MVEWFFDREFVEVQIFLGLFKIKNFSTKFYYLIKKKLVVLVIVWYNLFQKV